MKRILAMILALVMISAMISGFTYASESNAQADEANGTETSVIIETAATEDEVQAEDNNVSAVSSEEISNDDASEPEEAVVETNSEALTEAEYEDAITEVVSDTQLAAALTSDDDGVMPIEGVLSESGVGFHCSNYCAKNDGEKANKRIEVYGNDGYANGAIYAISGQTGLDIWLIPTGTQSNDKLDIWVIRPDQGTFVCSICGNDDWYSFSNKDGEFDGRNVQLYNVNNIVKPPVTTEPAAIEVSDNVNLITKTKTIVNLQQREVTPHEEWTRYVSDTYNSVTATYADYMGNIEINPKSGKVTEKSNGKVIVPYSNHFTYAAFTQEELEEGVDLALVVGNKLDRVGDANIIAVDGELMLSFGTTMDNSKWGFVAFNDTTKLPKNGNIHSDKIFGGHSNNVKTDMPNAGTDNKIYIYVHFDTLQFDLEYVRTKEWTVEGEYETVFSKTVKVTKVKEKLTDITYKVFGENDELIDPSDYANLTPGTYQVIFNDPHRPCDCDLTEDRACEGKCKEVAFSVELVAGETTIVEYKLNYYKTGEPIVKDIHLKDIVNETVYISIIKKISA